jgi:hypothetical protein
MIDRLVRVVRERRVGASLRHVALRGDESRRDAINGVRHFGEAARNRIVNLVKPLFQRARRQVRSASRRRTQLAERWGFYKTEWSIERELEKLAASGRTIVAGPWLSEVGFETLYWIPFLHWFRAAMRVPAERIVAVSRGGAESWYAGIAARYIDIWDDLDPAEFARRNAARGVTKQYEPSDLDRDVLAAVARRLGTSDFEVLHPGLMYRLFTLYWSGQRAMGFVDAHTRFTRMEPPLAIDPALLPRDYVAAKFYAARSLPDTPEVRARVQSMVAAVSERMPVVLLDTGLILDEHADYDLQGGRVISARSWMTPRNNLAVQTQIIAGARAFIGTCGSLAWLAPRLGVDTSALYIDPKWLHAHLAVAMRASHKLGAGRFAVADLRALEPIGLPEALTR